MPTASQCLILMTDEGSDHRLSMRRYSGVNANVSMPNMFVAKELEQSTYCDDPKINEKLPSLFNDGSRQDRAYQLIVNGYRGTMSCDSTGKTFRWQIESRDSEKSVRQRQNISINTDNLNNKIVEHHEYSSSPPAPWTKNTATNRQENIPRQYGVDGNSYERLENLGFRRRQTRGPSTIKKLDVTDNQHLTGIPGIINDIKYLPTPPGHKSISINNAQTLHLDDKSGGDSSSSSNESNTRNEIKNQAKTLSLLDEVKQKVNYDGRVLPAMHMRKSLPESIPTAVCFSVRTGNMSHTEIKELVQSQTGYDVKSVRYDPVSVRAGSDNGSRWIVTFESGDICTQVIRGGLELDGEKIVLKSLDEIHLFEYTAYLAKCEEDKNKTLRSKSSKRITNGRRQIERRYSKIGRQAI